MNNNNKFIINRQWRIYGRARAATVPSVTHGGPWPPCLNGIVKCPILNSSTSVCMLMASCLCTYLYVYIKYHLHASPNPSPTLYPTYPSNSWPAYPSYPSSPSNAMMISFSLLVVRLNMTKWLLPWPSLSWWRCDMWPTSVSFLFLVIVNAEDPVLQLSACRRNYFSCSFSWFIF